MAATRSEAAVDVSLVRLYLLRAMYLLVVVGLGVTVWPGVIHQSRPWELMEGVVACMLAAFSALSLLGLRYPLRMLPLLMWELVWKCLWLFVVVRPAWLSGHMDQAIIANAIACSLVVLIPIVMPWRHVWQRYIRQDGDRWLPLRSN